LLIIATGSTVIQLQIPVAGNQLIHSKSLLNSW